MLHDTKSNQQHERGKTYLSLEKHRLGFGVRVIHVRVVRRQFGAWSSLVGARGLLYALLWKLGRDVFRLKNPLTALGSLGRALLTTNLREVGRSDPFLLADRWILTRYHLHHHLSMEHEDSFWSFGSCHRCGWTWRSRRYSVPFVSMMNFGTSPSPGPSDTI